MTTAEIRITGPPGTGKTTHLAERIRKAVETVGPKSVVVCSFTRAAAAELVGRDLPVPRENVGTLHAFAFRVLGRPTIIEASQALLGEWNRQAGSGAQIAAVNDRFGDSGPDSAEVWDGMAASSNGSLWESYVLARHKDPTGATVRAVRQFRELDEKWNAFREETGCVDFTGLIEDAIRFAPHAPGKPLVFYVDEAQDFSALELKLTRQWGEATGYGFVMVGDGDQCAPAGSMVSLTGGAYKPIEEVEVGDPVITYSRKSSKFVGVKRAANRVTRVAKRWAEREERVYQISVESPLSHDDDTTRTTGNHQWLVRWADRHTNACCVYLMRRGDWFRVGWCQLFSKGGALHLLQRARIEKADGVWILDVFDARQDASLRESYVAARYGLPTFVFEPVNGDRGYQTLPSVAAFFGQLTRDVDLQRRAIECLRHHGRDIERPFWPAAGAAQGRTTLFKCYASNLISDLMLVPTQIEDDESEVKWRPITVWWDEGGLEVYSLEVENDHTYIQDGILTGNCIYEWTGADPRALAAVDLPEKRRPVLAQSYRVPFEVHRHAVDWVRQTPGRVDDPEYYPRRVDPADPTSAFAIGAVDRMGSTIDKDPEGVIRIAEEAIADERSVMILATCGYMLESVIATAYGLGVPFSNRYRRRNRSWNPLAPPTRGVGLVEKVRAFLEGPEKWTARDLGKIASILKADGVFLRGRKKVAEVYAKRDGAEAMSVDHAALELLFTPSAIVGIEARSMTWLGAHLTPNLHRRVEYFYRIVQRHGTQALTREPLLTIGTIHSVKGGEADTVLLSCGQSWAAAREAVVENRSAPLYRLMYVGMTRARERLVLCGACSFGSPSP